MSRPRLFLLVAINAVSYLSSPLRALLVRDTAALAERADLRTAVF